MMETAEVIDSFIDAHLLVFIGFAIAWLTFFIGLSVVLRRRSGKPIFTSRPPEAVFWETRVSGHQGGWRALGGARNILQIAITANTLVIRPMFPFNLMFLPEIWGMEASVPREAVRSISQQPKAWGRPTLAVMLDKPGGGDLAFYLRLKDAEGFARTLGRQLA